MDELERLRDVPQQIGIEPKLLGHRRRRGPDADVAGDIELVVVNEQIAARRGKGTRLGRPDALASR